jgi:hypothetical protein
LISTTVKKKVNKGLRGQEDLKDNNEALMPDAVREGEFVSKETKLNSLEHAKATKSRIMALADDVA